MTLATLALCLLPPAPQDAPPAFSSLDVFELERALDPQVSPDGTQVVYVRSGFDIQTDSSRNELWLIDVDGHEHRPLGAGGDRASSPRWSPDGKRIAYLSSESGSTQLGCLWLESGVSARLTQLPESPSGLTWSPDGRRLAFSMFVEQQPEKLAVLPAPPEGAEWAAPPIVVERTNWRADGAGRLDHGYHHLFVVPSEGGTPRQVTTGDFDHRSAPSWTPDGKRLVFSANRRADAELEPNDSEVYALDLESGALTALTDRFGPDSDPVVSPDGAWIAYVGFDDQYQGYQIRNLYVMRADGSESRVLTAELDRSVSRPRWSATGDAVFFQYDSEGEGRVGRVSLAGRLTLVATGVGDSIGRPYGGGSFSVSAADALACTVSDPARPADVAWRRDLAGEPVRLTDLNAELLEHRSLGAVEEFTVPSSHDGLPIQAWIVYPPDFDPSERYPLLLEIHGGPTANYGARFSAELQLYAAAGYVVLYANPRGSSSYGAAFGNQIHHAYPGYDYDDLMTCVDAVLERGFTDPEQLFVTGGSGGGVLTAWIVGKTERFRAAVVAKPVIHWTSFVLTADMYPFFVKYWFPALPWEDPLHYWERSPLSLVGNVTTPTMLLTGEEDFRTPMSESEQYYQALKLRGVDTALVRIPGASHGIASRPSRLIAKVGCVLAWFERYR